MDYNNLIEITYNSFTDFAVKEIDQMQDNFIMGRENSRKFPFFWMVKTVLVLNKDKCPEGIIDDELMDCMLSSGFCNDVETQKLINIWECETGQDGINYMQLESKPDELPPDFIVR